MRIEAFLNQGRQLRDELRTFEAEWAEEFITDPGNCIGEHDKSRNQAFYTLCLAERQRRARVQKLADAAAARRISAVNPTLNPDGRPELTLEELRHNVNIYKRRYEKGRTIFDNTPLEDFIGWDARESDNGEFKHWKKVDGLDDWSGGNKDDATPLSNDRHVGDHGKENYEALKRVFLSAGVNLDDI